jgi:hypothetical protein
MERVSPLPSGSRAWPDTVARQIHDPVRRLQFLRAVGPAVVRFQVGRKRRRMRALASAALALALAIGLSVFVVRGSSHDLRPRSAPPPEPKTAGESPAPSAADIWLVESVGESETYSNGLRIDNRFLTAARPRSYLAFPLKGGPDERSVEPAGIVFHTTESRIAPFEAKQNGLLKRIGESLLEYVRRRQSYNFVIDRFGRVYRVVAENQVAYHAGHSIWADDRRLYIGLNESFIGVSFEAANGAGQAPALGSAQARSAEMLVELLRHRYRIPASNCVTHAQVSVNPTNFRVGYHVDWSGGFPFEAIRLPDNNAIAPPSVWAFGFDADPVFFQAPGDRVREGVARARAILEARAAADGLTPSVYRVGLRRCYREMLARVRVDRVGTARVE